MKTRKQARDNGTMLTKRHRHWMIGILLLGALAMLGSVTGCSNMITELTENSGSDVTTDDGGTTGGDGGTTGDGNDTIAVTGVSVSPTSASIVAGDTQQLTATVSPTDASDTSVTWSSSDEAVAKVDSFGVVTGEGYGTATITVTTTDGSKTAEATFSVTGVFTISGNTIDIDGTAIPSSSGSFAGEGNLLVDLDVDQSNDLWVVEQDNSVTQYDISDPDNPTGTTFGDGTEIGSGGNTAVAVGDGVLAVAQREDPNSFVYVWDSDNRDVTSPDLTLELTGSETWDVDIGGDMLIASERKNHTVRIWKNLADKLAAADGTPNPSPEVTLGTGVVGTSGATQLNNPWGVWTDGEKIVVADPVNSRVLVWNSVPDVDGAAADVVIGQEDFTGNDAVDPPNRSSLALTSFGYVTVDAAGKLFVSDYGNNRVLVFNEIPTSNGAEADAVIGQSVFTTGATGTLDLPTGIAVDQTGSLWVAEYNNNQIDRFD